MLLVGLALGVDVAWSEYRLRRSRRTAERRAETLTTRFCLPRF
jgi:hypothetical protein